MSVGNSNGPYLRVLTPVTSDGVSLVTVNDRIKYREDHLPLSAQKMLEKKNEKLPTSLRKKIEVVNDYVKPAIKPQQQVVQNDFQEDAEGELTDVDPEPQIKSTVPAPIPDFIPKNKGGRPSKNATNA